MAAEIPKKRVIVQQQQQAAAQQQPPPPRKTQVVSGARMELDPDACEVMPLNYGNFSCHIFGYITAHLIGLINNKQPCVSDVRHSSSP